MKKLKKTQRRELIRIGEYLVSGGAFFWSGYGILILLREVLGLNLLFSTSVAYTVGWTVNYLLQRYWVFNNPRLSHHQMQVTGRYIFISLVNLVINYIILWSLESVGISVYIGQFISAGFFTVWNYLIYKFWVFYVPRRQRRKPLMPAAAKTAKLKRRIPRYHNHPGIVTKAHLKAASR